MSWREVEFTANRQLIHDLLLRARTFHAPVSANFELDITDLRARLQATARPARQWGLVSYVARATAIVVRKHPVLQRHLFTSWLGKKREVVFDRISCTLIVNRKASDGEDILFPLLIEDIDKMSIEEIDAFIARHRDGPFEELEQFKAMQRVRKAPRLALQWFSYKARSDPDFYLKYFGTYGVSALFEPNGALNAMSNYANTVIAFLPTSMRQRPWVHEGKIVPREILNLAVVFDHNLIDGLAAKDVSHSIRDVFEKPDLVLSPAGPGASR
jgi:pyruvate/2-oxoglutarate dehydrogenase complex dihydrolipoamide acyltransferase (E2) component